MHTGFRPCAFPWHGAPTGGCFVEEGSVEAVFERADGLVVGLDGCTKASPMCREVGEEGYDAVVELPAFGS